MMPSVQWQSGDDDALDYPETSESLGPLVVWFGWDEITVFVGRHHHRHFLLVDDATDCVPRAAAAALAYVQDVITDRVVFRLGQGLSSASQAPRPCGLLFRLWRALTPWGREAVWSGRPSGGRERRVREA
jgi:hypothetical protein